MDLRPKPLSCLPPASLGAAHEPSGTAGPGLCTEQVSTGASLLSGAAAPHFHQVTKFPMQKSVPRISDDPKKVRAKHIHLRVIFGLLCFDPSVNIEF